MEITVKTLIMKKHILVISFLIIASSAISQSSKVTYFANSMEGVSEFENLMLEIKLKSHPIHKLQYDKIEGSPYLFNDFKEGVVLLKSDTAFKLPLQYDMYNDIFEYKHGDKIYGLHSK
jgi:hypothetical protein